MKYNPTYEPEKINCWGVLKEIPDFSINRFTASCVQEKKIKAFFMTHHDDELVSQVLSIEFLEALLNTPENSSRLYLHKELLSYLQYYISTVRFPKEDRDVVATLLEKVEAADKIGFLEINLPIVLWFPKTREVQVTALSSGYDVGCVMLLLEQTFESDSIGDFQVQRILYSGNCRITNKDMERLQPLFYDKEMRFPKDIQAAYLDTTFCVNEVQELPPRGKVIFDLIHEITNMLTQDPEMRIEFKTECKGGMSRFFQHLADETCQAVHVPATLAEYWSRIEPVIGNKVTSLSDEEREAHGNYHYDCWEEHDHDKCVGPQEVWGKTYNASKIILGCHPDGIPSLEHDAVDTEQLLWIYGTPTIFQKSSKEKVALYSNHMSRYELVRFIKMLNLYPWQVVPLYRPHSMTIEQVNELLLTTRAVVSAEPAFLRREVPNCWFDLSNRKPVIRGKGRRRRNHRSEPEYPFPEFYHHTK